MKFLGALGAGLVLATILAIKLDGQAFALLAGGLAVAAFAVPMALLFASKNQCEQHPMARQEQQQPVAPVVIVLNSQYQPQQQLPDWTPPRWSLPAMQQQPVAHTTWEGLWEEPQPQQNERRFKVVGEMEPWGEDR